MAKRTPPKLATLPPRLALINGPGQRSGWGAPARGTRHQRGYGTAWDRLRRVILRRDGYVCQPCRRAGFIVAARIVDHIVNKAEGGTDDEANLESICAPCHKAKTQAESNRYRSPHE